MTKTLPLFVLLTLTLTACGAASLTRQDSLGGQIALRGGYMPAMSQARLLMAERCGGAFDVHEQRGGMTFQCHEGQSERSASALLAHR